MKKTITFEQLKNIVLENTQPDEIEVAEDSLSSQARNCLDLFAGNPPSMIIRALKALSPRVVDELKQHFGSDDLEELAMKISSGF